MQIKILLLGSNPSRKSLTNDAFDLSTKSGTTLDNWLNWSLPVDIQQKRLYMNVSTISTPKNRPLTAEEIRENLPTLKAKIDAAMPDRIVAVGLTAGKALTLLGIPHLQMPHPSGLNRQLNNKDFVVEKIRALQDYLSQCPKSG